MNDDDRQRLDSYLATREAAGTSRIVPRPPGARVPMSFTQQQVWLHAQMAAGVPVYHEPLTIVRRGPLDVGALGAALTEIVRRHEAWRTVFTIDGGQPVQIVQPPFTVAIPFVDLESLSPDAREREALRLASEDACQPLDLARGPLLRARLVRLGPDEHRLYLTVHHIVIDGVSLYRVLVAELTTLYAAFAAGRPSPLPELALQYGDFALWQSQRLVREPPDASIAYWRNRLAGAPALALTTDRGRPSAVGFAGARQLLTLPRPLTDLVRELAHRERTSVFGTLLAAFVALLHRLTGQDDVVLGTLSAARTRPELEPLLGFFANVLPLRADLGGDPTFRELLRRVRDATIEDLAHDDVPFEWLVRELGVERDPGRHPLFQVVFTLEAPRAALPVGWRVRHLDVDTQTSKFDLYVELDEQPETIVGRLVYRTDLFDAVTIEGLAVRYARLLEAAVREPGRRLSELPLLDDAERARLLAWGRPQAAYPRTTTVHAIFEAQAARTPGATAVIAEDGGLTYGELEAHAERIARVLRRRRVGRGDVVGVWLPRSADFVVAILAILKAGAAYLPLDPGQPRLRLHSMLEDAGVRVVLARSARDLTLLDRPLDVVTLDADVAGRDPGPRAAEGGPDDLAYVMFTSGSTGRPKGVAVPHRGILRLLFGQSWTRLDASRVILLTSAVTFDLSTFELWGALLHGGCSVLAPPGTPTPRVLAERIRRHRVTTVLLTAPLFNALVDEAPETLDGVAEVLVGAEALSLAHVRRAFARLRDVAIVNAYGPTECTALACCHRMLAAPPDGAASVPIGPPIANTEAYVLDAHRRLVPIGVVGELYLGGPGLAKGYLERPDLTAERFVPHPFDPAPGARVYRTGDLARWRADGTLEFLGRNDQQLKLRGFRVEPGEIETALAAHPDVREAVVVARQSASGERELVAFLITRQGSPPPDLAVFLRERLPAFMIPSTFVAVAAIPLTAHGKADRAALAALPAPAPPPGASRLAPRDPLEAWLAELWEELLGVAPIGVRADFFGLGGHSLAAVRMVHRIEHHLGQRIPLATLHAHATVEELARVLVRGDRERFPTPVVKLQADGTRRPFFFFHGDVNGGGLYCRDLARHLGPDQPLFAIHPLGFDARPVPATIEAMAATHLSLIRELQPRGPYFVGGFCNGALTAYEVAGVLARAGESVEPVVLIGAVADARLRRVGAMLRGLGQRLGLGKDEVADYFGRLRHLAQRWRRANGRGRFGLARGFIATAARELGTRAAGVRPSPFSRVPIDPDAGAALRVADALLSPETYARYFTAMMAYVPPRFPGRLLVLWPDEDPLEQPPPAGLGWQELSDHVEVVVVPGNHHTVVTHHVELIARAIRSSRDDNGAFASARPAA
ncbi:MAG TPA: amino acid adenylation domain-containing protein [Methylomirabilota bacterium]|nr:amino acid adenylation domain-containing protein [Methylomirabilota bacterium]